MQKTAVRKKPPAKKQAAQRSAPGKARQPPAASRAKTPVKGKWVYSFGDGTAEGSGSMRDLLGGKGAGLAEMASLGLPVPPGFTITTEVCTYYYQNGKTYPADLEEQVNAALARLGLRLGRKFGDPENPLLVSVRSGARASMPGMMDTVLNLGLNDETVETLARKSDDKRFAYDSFRRFITMYSDVVLGVGHHHFEEILDDHKDRHGYTLDTDLSAQDWGKLVRRYKQRVEEEHGEPFPRDPRSQLWGAIGAVFGSCTTFRKAGAPRSPFRPWCSGIWGRLLQPAWRSPAILRLAKSVSTASFCSMRKGKMWLQAFAPPRRSPRRRAKRRIPTSLRWRRRFPRHSRSSPGSMACSSGTIAICRILNSPWSKASCGCCRRAQASGPPKRRSRLPSSLPMRA